MPTAQSKEVSKEEPSQADDDAKHVVSVFSKTTMLAVITGAMLFTSRQAVTAASGLFSDAAAQALFLTRIASAGAAFEFLVNPIFGKLVDAQGRRPYLVFLNLPVIVVRFLSYAYSKSMFPLILEELVTIPLVTAYFTTMRAVLADKLDAVGVAQANATIGIYAGLGTILGPALGAALMKRFEARVCYLVAAAVGIVNTCLLSTVKESLTPDKAKPINFGDMQPFSFTQLFRDSVLGRLMLTTGLQSFSEGRSINEVYVIYMRNNLKWTWSQTNLLVSMSGVALVFSGIISKPMLNAMGMRRFTFFNNLFNSLSLSCYGGLMPFALLGVWVRMNMGVFFAAPAARKRDAVEALIMQIGQDRGFGNGFISGCMNNFRAIPNVLGPLMFGSAYAWGAKREKVWLPFVLAILTIVMAELTFNTLSDTSLGLNAKGLLIKDEKKKTEKEAPDAPKTKAS
mmetsp:Transcript_19025/g.59815  ORF Transcript_19025/g.59815 Transcript_19025/m.59815 type:complete len:455 (-) Transcript_19025:257-1621(-)|eukprot:CAMPEP_0204566448 /NCGR_PEP_ID=MMETSP0661-20131031/36051_1 /ASSEMBLY_ACC=CAM_ASM_000606 /TAXON_ID=109239 /ORGANISM="Alexandrium margalefi, Strain AMGDE01CS-322" /LENGTH=454 /DNA_ID=CAMNT_0051574299 /DNA_START=50 /DNA_END=1414 /DNA_ORIENTATION=+